MSDIRDSNIPERLREMIQDALRRKAIEKKVKAKKTESEMEREIRRADNFLFFMNTIVEHKYPKSKPWQKVVLIHSERGLMSKFSYDQARLQYYFITEEWK
jgi:hypothetical protein